MKPLFWLMMLLFPFSYLILLMISTYFTLFFVSPVSSHTPRLSRSKDTSFIWTWKW